MKFFFIFIDKDGEIFEKFDIMNKKKGKYDYSRDKP